MRQFIDFNYRLRISNCNKKVNKRVSNSILIIQNATTNMGPSGENPLCKQKKLQLTSRSDKGL